MRNWCPKRSVFVYLCLCWLAFGWNVPSPGAEPIVCQAEATLHLQGVDSDGEYIFWSFTNLMFKTDLKGNVLSRIEVPSHHGDCCVHDGKLYVSVDLRTKRPYERFIYVYDTKKLDYLERIELTTFSDGPDGIVFVDGHFYIAEGKAKNDPQPFSWIFQFTSDFKLVKKFKIPGIMHYGIQAMTFAHGDFWLGTYSKEGSYRADKDLNIISKGMPGMSVGVYALPKSDSGEPRLMIARVVKNSNGTQTASLSPYVLKNGKLVAQ